MKIEGRTLSVLKNFASINPSLLFKPGTQLRTMSPQKTILAQAVIKETIPNQFAIFDVSRFLSVLSLFQNPTLTFQETYAQISDGQQRVNYTFTDPTMIVVASDKTPNVESNVSFTLSSETLSKVQKAMGVLSMPEFAVVGDGESISVQAIDSKNSVGDVFAITVGTTTHKFRMIFKAENMKMIPGQYLVDISFKGFARFTGSNGDIEYWVAIESKDSTF